MAKTPQKGRPPPSTSPTPPRRPPLRETQFAPQQPLAVGESPSPPTDHYLKAAQRMITLETRIHPDPSPPSRPTVSSSSGSESRTAQLTSALADLQGYGSPSYSSRPSPISLPSKARRVIRGPARRAPPNTPTSDGWGDDREVRETGDSGEGEEGGSTPAGQSLGGSDFAASSEQSSSRASTPCPTSPISHSSELDIRLADERGTGESELGSGGSCVKSDPPGSKEGHSLNHTLEGIARELGSEASLGYEIRNFRWDKCCSFMPYAPPERL